jgi:HK97 family phage portal protein
MKILGFEIRRTAEARNAENPTVPVSAANFLAYFGIQHSNLPSVTIDTALTVPAVAAAVAFLPRTLAALPMHAYRRTKDGPVKIAGKMETVIHENPNPLMDSFKFRQYFWQQVFTGGRGLAWIERAGANIEAIWPFDPTKVTIKRNGLRLVYRHENRDYPAEDVIDIPFMLKADQTAHYGPVNLAAKAIQLALAMNDYASGFFAGGGVPPLALTGPLPAGPEAIRRAQADIKRAVDAAKKNNEPVFPIPAGYKLEPVGLDPAKGQMEAARRFQIEEIARGWQLPPVFLQDLTHGTFSNVEQQDLHLVKHLIGQWAQALEGEMNLKLFGRLNGNRYVEHNVDGLLRGDFKTRMEGLSKGIQNAILTPNEARSLENRPAMPKGNDLMIQGATVPLGTQPVQAELFQPMADDGDEDVVPDRYPVKPYHHPLTPTGAEFRETEAA